MEILFENVYTDDEKLLREIIAKVGMKKVWPWLPVYIILDLVYLFRIPELGIVAWLCFAFCLGYTFWILLMPYHRAKKAIRKKIEYYDGVIPETVIRFGEDISIQEVDSLSTVHYHKISKVSFTKNSIIIHLNSSGYLALLPTGFTKGTLAEFKQFLRKKRPDLKIPE